MTQKESIAHLTSYVAFTPINMDRETGNIKKREFAMDILNNDLFPHCATPEQKIYFRVLKEFDNDKAFYTGMKEFYNSY